MYRTKTKANMKGPNPIGPLVAAIYVRVMKVVGYLAIYAVELKIEEVNGPNERSNTVF